MDMEPERHRRSQDPPMALICPATFFKSHHHRRPGLISREGCVLKEIVKTRLWFAEPHGDFFIPIVLSFINWGYS